jgi:RNA polymerase sigma-70 factor, ECF subfamily
MIGTKAKREIADSHLLAFVDRRPAVLVCPPKDALASRRYPVLLKFEDRKIANIRDYRHTAYLLEDAEIIPTG